MYHKARASEVIEWILKGETLDERQRRIQRFLENEGYLLPEPPRGVDRSEEGDTHIVRGRQVTVEYACSEGNLHFLRVIIKSDPTGRWYVETFYPRPALR